MIDVRRTSDDCENLFVQVALLDSGRATRATCLIGIPVHSQSGVGGSLQKQREVLPPVAGYDAICARCLDLGNIWRQMLETRHLVAARIAMKTRKENA